MTYRCRLQINTPSQIGDNGLKSVSAVPAVQVPPGTPSPQILTMIETFLLLIAIW
jgi:hypothetical protein